jgi:hypothetical protein
VGEREKAAPQARRDESRPSGSGTAGRLPLLGSWCGSTWMTCGVPEAPCMAVIPRLRPVADAPVASRTCPDGRCHRRPPGRRSRWAGGPGERSPKVDGVHAPLSCGTADAPTLAGGPSEATRARPPSSRYPQRRMTRRRSCRSRPARVFASAAVLAALFAACTGSAAPTSPPDPSTACGGADVQRAAGFYPDLEVRLPVLLAGAAPSSRDSGRYCSAKTLGPLRADGYQEIRFAGETFPVTAQSGVSLVVYEAPGLSAAQVDDAFRGGAGTGKKVTVVSDDPYTVAGRAGRRLVVLNDATRQVVVVWPAAEAGVVRIVIAADVSDATIDAAISALEAVRQPG